VCAGSFDEIWDIILHYVSKYINVTNPKLPFYLNQRFLQFKDIVKERHYVLEIDLRNNDKVRKIFAEIVSTLAVSEKSAIPVDFSSSSSSPGVACMVCGFSHAHQGDTPLNSSSLAESSSSQRQLRRNECFASAPLHRPRPRARLRWEASAITGQARLEIIRKICKICVGRDFVFSARYFRDQLWLPFRFAMYTFDYPLSI
jgi:hypothetical protein